MLDVLRLKSKMALFDDTQKTLAEALGISRATLATRISNQSSFTQAEIYNIMIRYELTSDEITEIFFAEKITQSVK